MLEMMNTSGQQPADAILTPYWQLASGYGYETGSVFRYLDGNFFRQSIDNGLQVLNVPNKTTVATFTLGVTNSRNFALWFWNPVDTYPYGVIDGLYMPASSSRLYSPSGTFASWAAGTSSPANTHNSSFFATGIGAGTVVFWYRRGVAGNSNGSVWYRRPSSQANFTQITSEATWCNSMSTFVDRGDYLYFGGTTSAGGITHLWKINKSTGQFIRVASFQGYSNRPVALTHQGNILYLYAPGSGIGADKIVMFNMDTDTVLDHILRVEGLSSTTGITNIMAYNGVMYAYANATGSFYTLDGIFE